MSQIEEPTRSKSIIIRLYSVQYPKHHDYDTSYEKRLKAQPTGKVYPRKVYARDKWICQLCGRPVNPRLRYPNPMSASLDHIVPISRGGEHNMSNVQLAHWSCNVQRGAGPIHRRHVATWSLGLNTRVMVVVLVLCFVLLVVLTHL